MINKKYKKAIEYEKNYKWAEALKIYKKFYDSKTNDDNIFLLSKIGWCHSRLNNYEKSAQTYKRLTKKEPKIAKWFYMTGYQYYANQKWHLAIEWFKKSLNLYPNYLKAKYRLGYALTQTANNMFTLKSAEFKEAFNIFKDGLRIWNEMNNDYKNKNKKIYGNICFQLGKMYIEKKTFKKAIYYLKEALNISSDLNIKYQLAKAYNLNKKPEKALSTIPKKTNKYYIKELKADIYINLEEYNKAIELLQNILIERKKDYLYRKLANVHIKKDDFFKAYKHANKALLLDNKNHKNFYTISIILFNLELYNLAKNKISKAIKFKDKKYNSNYNKAKKLLKEINRQININNHIEDNKSLINKLNKIKNKTNVKLNGIVTTYFNDKGYGFIKSKGKDYFFHITNVLNPNKNNIRKNIKVVILSTKVTEKGLEATKIKLK